MKRPASAAFASATTPAVKDRLLDEAEQHDNLAELADEPELELEDAAQH